MGRLRPRHLCAAAGLLLAAGLLAAAPDAGAQMTGVYAVEGTVRDPGGDPVAGAEVTLTPANDSGEPRRTETAEDGSYRFGNLSSGTYDLVADASCCGPDHAQTHLEGTTLTRQVDLDLTDQAEPGGTDTVVLYGRTQADVGGEGVADVQVTARIDDAVRARDDAPRDGGETHSEPRHRTFAVRSDDDGTYALELPRGELELEARRDGYDVTRGHLELREDRHVDVPVRASSTEAARLAGEVRSSDGGPVPGASLYVRVTDDRCEAGGCPGDEESRRSDGVRFEIEPAAQRYDRTTAGSDGRWRLSVYPGTVELRARAPDHLREERTLGVQGGEEREVNLTLVAVPPDSVALSGTVTDAETGEPVPDARVEVRNQKWGTRNETGTDGDGAYDLRTKPGYTTLRVSAPRDPHACAHAVEGTSEPKNVSARTVAARPPPCEERDVRREKAYLPRVRTFEAEGGGDRQASFDLVPAPDRSATIQGWVLNASSGEGIPDLAVGIRNELTRERGVARTDDDGSFALNVTPGYYTLRTPLRRGSSGYFTASTNVEVGPDATRTLALNLTPGAPRDRCCVVYADGHAAPARGSGSGGDVVEAAPAADLRSPGGGLGPYDPSVLGAEGGAAGEGSSTPGAGPVVAAAALAGAAALARRRP